MKKILVMLLAVMLLSGCIGGGDMPDEKGKSPQWGHISFGAPFLGQPPISGAPAPPWGTAWDYPKWGSYQSDVGTKGKGAPSGTEGWTPAPAQEGDKSWTKWLPYLQMLGIRPMEGRGWTGTSPAMRGRMQAGAVPAMQDYMSAMGLDWGNYLDWTNSMMPRNPMMSARRWTPSMNYYRR